MERAACGSRALLGVPWRGSPEIGGTLLLPSWGLGSRGEGAGSGLTGSWIEDRPPVRGRAESWLLRRPTVRTLGQRGPLKDRGA